MRQMNLARVRGNEWDLLDTAVQNTLGVLRPYGETRADHAGSELATRQIRCMTIRAPCR